jgi:hypothetical protein
MVRGLGVMTLVLAVTAPSAPGALVAGGGRRATDCVAVFDAPGANAPAPPRPPRHVDCVDGDPSCDADGLRNARCIFDLRLCINSSAVTGCTPVRADSLAVDHAVDNGDPRFDIDFQALQNRANLLGFPDNEDPDRCTLTSTLTVVLRAPAGSRPWRRAKKVVRTTATGFASGRTAADRDRMRFRCRPEGDGLYGPRDLYTGTFDRIRQQLFATSCALSGCHDSNAHQNDLILLPNAAYSEIVGVTPFNGAAAADGLLRVFPGDPQQSFLYRKITCDLLPTYGSCMPLTGPPISQQLREIVRLWILGDQTLGPAPETGWVPGTDQ